MNERNTRSINEFESVDSGAIPEQLPNYVKFGNFEELKKIVESELFFPVFITGLSGNGKTWMVKQICAELKRKLYRVNITIETDEDDLFGGFRLYNGETVWFDGPVIKAMKTGSVLLLDEVDLASSKIMCLQPILEGGSILLKKINTFVKPEAGFNIIATANTKGRGNDDGKFAGTNILNEAFLERFPITIEQKYPDIEIEKEILRKVFSSHKMSDDNFINILAEWSNTVRKTQAKGALDDLITTRRLIQIANAYSIFRNKKQALELCLNRFDPYIKDSFIELYSNLDDKIKDL